MSTPARRVATVLLGSLMFLGQGSLAMAASPSAPPPNAAATPPSGTTLTAEPSILALSMEAGGTATGTLTLRAGVALDLTVEPQGLGQSPDDGSFTFVAPDDDVSPYTARPFVDVEPDRFTLAAGGSQKVTVTVRLPADATDGERYALLKVDGKPVAGSGNVGIGVALGVGVLIALPDTTQTVTGSIEDLTVSGAAPGQPVTVAGTIENTGNTHYGAPPSAVYQVATIRDANGTAVGGTRGTLTGNSIVPTFRRQFELLVAPSQVLPAGAYTVDVEVGLEDGTVLDTATGDLVVAGGAVAGVTGGPPSEAIPAITLLLAAAVGILLAVVLVLGVRSRRRPAVSQ
jgi:hypothetical protein